MHSSGSDGEPAVIDGDLDALVGLEAGVLDPPAGELLSRIKRRFGGALMRGLMLRRLKTFKRWSVESLPDEDMPLGVVDGKVDALTGHEAEVSEQSVGDLHPRDERLVRPAWQSC